MMRRLVTKSMLVRSIQQHTRNTSPLMTTYRMVITPPMNTNYATTTTTTTKRKKVVVDAEFVDKTTEHKRSIQSQMAIFKQLAENGNVDEMISHVGRMDTIDTEIINLALESCQTAQDADRLLERLMNRSNTNNNNENENNSNDNEISQLLDTTSFNHLIRLTLKENEIESAVSAYFTMTIDRQLKPNTYSVESVLKAVVNSRVKENAKSVDRIIGRLYKDSIRFNIIPTDDMNVLFVNHCKEFRLDIIGLLREINDEQLKDFHQNTPFILPTLTRILRDNKAKNYAWIYEKLVNAGILNPTSVPPPQEQQQEQQEQQVVQTDKKIKKKKKVE